MSLAWPYVPIVAGCCLLVVGCNNPVRLEAVPVSLQKQASVLGRDDLRYWGDEASPAFAQDALEAFLREKTILDRAGHRGPLPPANFLAISGGGENGAYGAGLLVGWTRTGTRPNFKGVTGISTGALTAPFAFLGPAYDDKLKEVYTEISAKDVLVQRGYLAVLMDDAVADNAPLRRTVSRFVDEAMLKAIAAEHAKGRTLLVATTNLDARRPTIWNMGKIATVGGKQALEIFHEILIASAAIPGAFPPVMIDVEIGGKKYQEMHVDGGASAQVFIYPPDLEVKQISRERGIKRVRNLYVLRNARLDPDWVQVDRRAYSIMGRAVSSLIQTQGVGDLYRIYLTTQRDRFDFNLAYIPETFSVPLREPFDQHYMKALFQLGYDRAVAGYPWAKTPPGFTAPQIEPPVPPPTTKAQPRRAG
jgi:predicted acylesterase/phospholipase RssA